jgi:hypothetical protein
MLMRLLEIGKFNELSGNPGSLKGLKMEHEINAWTRKSKKLKARSFAALEQLYRVVKDDTDRRARTDKASHMDDAKRD